MSQPSIRIRKDHMRVVLDLALASGDYKILVYEEIERGIQRARTIASIGGQHEFVDMTHYIWRDATEEERVADIACAYAELEACDSFQGSGETQANGKSMWTWICHERSRHTHIQDYGMHIECEVGMQEVLEELARREGEEIAAGLGVSALPASKTNGGRL